MKINDFLKPSLHENADHEDAQLKAVLAKGGYEVVEISRKYPTMAHIMIRTPKHEDSTKTTWPAQRYLSDHGYDNKKYRVFPYVEPYTGTPGPFGGDWYSGVKNAPSGVRWTGD